MSVHSNENIENSRISDSPSSVDRIHRDQSMSANSGAAKSARRVSVDSATYASPEHRAGLEERPVFSTRSYETSFNVNLRRHSMSISPKASLSPLTAQAVDAEKAGTIKKQTRRTSTDGNFSFFEREGLFQPKTIPTLISNTEIVQESEESLVPTVTPIARRASTVVRRSSLAALPLEESLEKVIGCICSIILL